MRRSVLERGRVGDGDRFLLDTGWDILRLNRDRPIHSKSFRHAKCFSFFDPRLILLHVPVVLSEEGREYTMIMYP